MVSAVVVATLVVMITVLGLEVSTFASFLVVVAGKEVVISARTVVEVIVGPVVTTVDGFVVDRV